MSNLNLAAASKALADLAAERARLEGRIEQAARTREEVAAAPLCKTDVQAIFLARIDALANTGPALLERPINMIASRPSKLWDGQRLPVLPDDAGGLGYLICALLPNEITVGIKRIFASMQEIPGAGLPASQRAEKLAELDRRLDADHKALSSLRDAAVAAGLAWPDKGMF